jgi:hypothetical protein
MAGNKMVKTVLGILVNRKNTRLKKLSTKEDEILSSKNVSRMIKLKRAR